MPPACCPAAGRDRCAGSSVESWAWRARRIHACASIVQATTRVQRFAFAVPQPGENRPKDGRQKGLGFIVKGHAAITVYRSREEVERLWRSSEYRPSYVDEADAAVTFKDAPGARGTEIHVDLAQSARGGRL